MVRIELYESLVVPWSPCLHLFHKVTHEFCCAVTLHLRLAEVIVVLVSFNGNLLNTIAYANTVKDILLCCTDTFTYAVANITVE